MTAEICGCTDNETLLNDYSPVQRLTLQLDDIVVEKKLRVQVQRSEKYSSIDMRLSPIEHPSFVWSLFVLDQRS